MKRRGLRAFAFIVAISVSFRIPGADCNQNNIEDSLEIGPGLWEEPVVIPDFSWGSRVAADLDGDGDLDLAVGHGGQIDLFENLWPEAFAPPVIQTSRPGLYDLGAADLDLDGEVDLVTVSATSDFIAVLQNQGQLRFQESFFVTREDALALVVADLDRDGLPDLAVNRIQILETFRNLGAGGFAAWREISFPCASFSGPLAADLDADGHEDLVVQGGDSDDSLSILRNDGRGGFDAPRKKIPVGPGLSDATAVDLDGNGRIDLALLDSADRSVRLLFNGKGTRPADPFLQVSLSTGPRPASLVAADLDGDRNSDLLTGGSSLLNFHRNEGEGRFAGPRGFAVPSWPSDLLAADMNGDGRLDVLSLHGNASRSYLEVRLQRAQPSTSVDCDRDGVPDECQEDCNRNGIPDACDLGSGRSPDCDGNGVPDECEDCNRNGVADRCDIDRGSHRDEDRDGVPDDCQRIRFTYGFDGHPTRIHGSPGETVAFEVFATLTTERNASPDGVQGWAIAIAVDGGSFEEITLQGLVVPTIFDHDGDPSTPEVNEPLELSRADFKFAAQSSDPSTCPPLEVARSAVVLNQLKKRVLPPTGRQRIARLGIRGVIPDEGCVPLTLVYRDRFDSLWDLVTFNGASHRPEMVAATVLLCSPPLFRRADSNADGGVDLSDAIATFSFLFLGGAAPDCLDAADANGDGLLDLSDPVFTLEDLFINPFDSSFIPQPGIFECGEDPTLDDLGCRSYAACP